jgi:PAS domain S-box-containing protein
MSFSTKTDCNPDNQSLQRLLDVLESIRDDVFSLDKDGNFVYINSIAAKGWGYTPTELLNKNIWRILPRFIGTAFEESMHEAMEKQEVRQLEWKALYASGYREVTIFPSSEGVTVYSKNITERKKAEEALKESEKRLKIITENTIDPIYIKDRQSRFIMANPACERAMGKSIDEMKGKTDEEIYTNPEIGRAILQTDKRIMDSGKSEVIEEIIDTPVGKRIYLSTKTPWCNSNGEVIGIIGISRDITERKKAEEALKEAEDKFRSLVESTSDMIWQVDENAVYTYVSPKIRDILGYEPEEIIGKTPFYLMDPEDEAKIVDVFIEIANKKEPFYGLQNWNIHKNGSRVLMETSGVPILDVKGELVGYRGIDRDITERKKAEEAAKRQTIIQQGARRILEAALKVNREELGQVCLSVAEEITDSKFGFIGELNPNGVEDIAISNPGWDACKIITAGGHRKPPGNFTIHGIYGRVLSDGKSLLTNDPVHHPDSIGLPKGHPPLNSFLGVPLKSEGKTIGMIAVGNKNGGFNEQDLNALESIVPYIVEAFSRKKAEQALKENEERFRLVAEAAKVMVYEIQYSTGNVTVFSGEEVIGYHKGEITGSTAWWLSQIHKDDIERVEEQAKKGIASEQEYMLEYRVKRKQGDYIFVHDTVKVVRDSLGNIVRLIGGLRDVTSRKQSEEALLKSKEQLEFKTAEVQKYATSMEKLAEERAKMLRDSERLATIGATAGMVGHDIRNPLQAITGDIYLTKTELDTLPKNPSKEAITENLNAIEENIFYINKIVADLQDFARPLVPSLSQVDIEPLIKAAIESKVLPTNIQASYHIDNCVRTICTDVDMLKRILNNLGLNAIQAMPNGGKVTVTATKNRDNIVISIQDTGEGIPEDVKPKLFKPMMTTKSKGQGFGLAVVKRLTEVLGGTVSFESEVGKGTKFTIELPSS